jgi:putative toxin-antitoxin system antitoxin component (TIGR02293 family)
MALLDPDVEETVDPAVARTATLLGGRRTLRRPVRSRLEAHDLIQAGIPARALVHLVDNVPIAREGGLEQAVGISLRTYQRRRETLDQPLSREQSGRAWKFAEILGRATEIMGTQHEAEQWLERPAIGLDQRRPIDLLSTPAGVQSVEDYLTRIEYGVYT